MDTFNEADMKKVAMLYQVHSTFTPVINKRAYECRRFRNYGND